MSDLSNYESISPTAKLVAWWRSFSDIEYSKEVATHTRAREAVNIILSGSGLSAIDTMWGCPILEIRYKSLLREISRSGCKNILELASGIALRGLVMTADPSITYVETDLPGITEEKVKLVEKIIQGSLREERPNLFLQSANALDADEVNCAILNLRTDQPLVVVHEGLIHYLNRQEIVTLTEVIASILKKNGGIWLTPDFEFKSNLENWNRVSSGSITIMEALARLTGRKMLEGAFESEQEMHSHFDRFGLVAERINQWDSTMVVTSAAASNIPNKELGNIKSGLILWRIAPKS